MKQSLSFARGNAVVVGIIVALALAIGYTPRAHGAEAERMTISRGGGTVAVERKRSAGRVLVLTGATGAKRRLDSNGGRKLGMVVRVAGCRGLPRLVVSINKTVVLNTVIRRPGWHRIETPRAIKPGGKLILTVRLANQARGKCRRAVRIDSYAFGPKLGAPSKPKPKPSPKPKPGHTPSPTPGIGTPPTPAPTAPPAPSPSTPTTAWWRPAQGSTWQWQLSGPLDVNVPAQVFDIDLFDRSAADVATLKARGSRVICYLSAGTWEPGRPDSGAFPASVIGASMDGWPSERWLDIRRLDVLGPIMERRLDQCRAKGFDAVEPDNVDGYTHATGFPLSAADQLAYNRFLANAAHARGLGIGLKNDLDQVAALAPSFDFAVNEECFQYSECGKLAPFLNAGKAVFNAEYSVSPSSFCSTARAMGISAIRKNMMLDAARESC